MIAANITYTIDEDTAKALKKLIRNLSITNLKEDFGLTDAEAELLQLYYPEIRD
jgi:hypothetical protein